MEKPKKVMVIAAHPDDEILGCGATMARHISLGDHVETLILGEGATSRDQNDAQQEVSSLRVQAQAANKILGVTSVHFGGLPDNRFDSRDLLDVIKVVEHFKRLVQPDVVYTHHSGDLNIDHRITFQAVLTAFRPIVGERLTELYSFEVASSTEWQHISGEYIFKPNVFVNVAGYIGKKLMAMSAYKSELRSYPHPRSLDALKVYAQRWGITVGMLYSEPFEAIRILK